VSAGLLLFRRSADHLELFLGHPGGPFWRDRDTGAWTLPKGAVDDGEELLAAALREFEEETGIVAQPPFLPLGSVRQRSGKRVHAWAWEGDADPARTSSNLMRTEWPRGSGHWLSFPEIDRCAWFDAPTARRKLIAAQAEFVDRLEAVLAGGSIAGPEGRPAADGDSALGMPELG
jgi:predicted NUDIX family NTP pyrophosphohydrolase